jgi:hypothetical protein
MLGFDALGRLALGQLPGATAAATIFEDSWHQPFNTDFVRRRPPYSAARQQFASYVEFAPFAEQWTEERFSYVSLSQPSQRRNPMHTGSQQFSALVEFAPFPEKVSADRWFVPFSEPVRFIRALPVSEQPFTLIVEEPPFFESVTADRWAPNLSEPVRFRRALPANEQQFASFVQFRFPELVSADRWFVPFSEPVRFRRTLLTANHQFEASLGLPITNLILTMAASLLGTASITGIPTSNYKAILNTTSRRLIYAAEISPWSVSR